MLNSKLSLVAALILLFPSAAFSQSTGGAGATAVSICTISASTCTTVGTTAADGGATSNNSTYAVDQLFSFNGTGWDRNRKDTYAAGPQWFTTGGSTKTAIAAATAGPTVLKATAGRLSSFLITTAGTTGTETFYDNASACSGTVIGIANGTTAQAGAIAGYFQLIDLVATNGITACGGTLSPALTVGFY
jgi:hypothetical protein